MSDKEFKLGDVLTDDDATKIFYRVKEHGLAGFHAWCLTEIVEKNKEKLTEIVGEYDPDYVAYVIEAYTKKIVKEMVHEIKENREHASRRLPQSLEEISGRTDWWKGAT
jgi:Mg/Co/Ni transporter MgtE